tara:strand:+ start:732 stop:1289 length:558 start_codon:yes stop_codon:yes gene_type:complete
MKKKVLSEIAMIYGDVDCPPGFEIDRDNIKSGILHNAFMEKDKRVSKNPQDISYNDYFVDYSPPLGHLQTYLREFFVLRYKQNLINKACFANVLFPGNSTISRKSIDPLNLKTSADYTCLYGIDIQPDSCTAVMEYDDNRRANRSWHIPLENNKFLIFPSTQRYFVTPNTSQGLNIILTMWYDWM